MLKQNIEWKLNTSNLGKLKEFQRLFSNFGMALKATQIDLPEIESDPLSVIAHKASQLEEYILVEDTSLDIDGASVGINVRWLLAHLNEYVGKQASWSVLLAYREKDEIYIYQGLIKGTIVLPRGVEGFGFDPFFLPNKAHLTLAEDKPDVVNARAKAVETFVEDKKFQVVKAIYDWKGSWQ